MSNFELRLETFSTFEDSMKSMPDSFAYAKNMYENQREAFMRERVALKRMTIPVDQRHSKKHFEPTLHKKLSKSFQLRQESRVSFPPLTRSKAKHLEKIDQIIHKCNPNRDTPELHRKIVNEKKSLRLYSDRMDWTIETLRKHSDLEYKVLTPLVDFLTNSRFQNEVEEKNSIIELKKGRRNRIRLRSSLV